MGKEDVGCKICGCTLPRVNKGRPKVYCDPCRRKLRNDWQKAAYAQNRKGLRDKARKRKKDYYEQQEEYRRRARRSQQKNYKKMMAAKRAADEGLPW